MQLTINGEPRSLPSSAQTVADLVEALQLDMRQSAVERNQQIVPRSLYADTPIADGDRIEIVSFIGGG
jgi:thiamine biosynthesis protein ThiS